MTETADRIRVLHVDDDPDLAELVGTFLEREDDRITVRTASSADEGLSLLADHDVDCIVSDYEMPGTNGIEFLEAVRVEYQDLPFVLYTGKGSEEVASDAISAGVTEYLQKESGTGQYAVLANRIANVVEQHRSRRVVEETERKLSEIADKSDDVLFVFDGDWTELEFVNSTYEELWDGTVDELRADPESFLENVHPEDRERARRSMERLSEGEQDTIEYRVRSSDGAYRWIRGESKPIFEDGELVRIVGFVRDVTGRKERERELERTTTVLSTLVETLPVGVIAEDEDRNVLATNDRALELFGLSGSTDEFAGADCERMAEDVSELFADPAAFVERIDELVDARRRVREEELALADGRTFTRSHEPIEFPDGEGHLWVYRDVTDQKRREERLRETSSRLEALFEQSPDMINVHDRDGNVLDPNPRLCEATGYDKSALTGMKVWELDREIDPEAATALWQGMDPRDRERVAGTYQRRDGSTFPVEVHVRRLDLPGPDRFMAISRDVSERRERERVLQRERDRFQAVFEESFDAMVIADDDGRYVEANQSATELFGLPRAELLGRSIDEFAPESFDFEAAWEAFQQSDRDRGTFPLVRPDGTERVVEYAATTNVGPGRHLSVLRDVTDREEREQELQRHNERLEEFASVVSHDLRNPLNVAQGRLELVRRESDGEHIEAIWRALDRMEMLITDLLALAREGETATDVTAVDLASVVEDCWDTVDTRDATLVVDVDHRIRADGSRLRQLFENLVRNAVEHGGPDVTVTVAELDDGFSVADDGPGIPSDERAAVFEAGYSTDERGTGFGLSIVKQVAQAHGWDLRATESADGGACFEVSNVEFADD